MGSRHLYLILHIHEILTLYNKQWLSILGGVGMNMIWRKKARSTAKVKSSMINGSAVSPHGSPFPRCTAYVSMMIGFMSP